MDKLKGDRTSVTISKSVHRELKIAAARLGSTQRVLLESIILIWLVEHAGSLPQAEQKED